RSTQLWIRSLQSDTPQSLAGTENASYPFWAADGRSIGFFSDGKLQQIDLAGGQAQTVADAASGRGGAWNGDGVILFAPATQGPLRRISAASGQVVEATTVTSPQISH